MIIKRNIKFLPDVFDLAKLTPKVSTQGIEDLVYRLMAYTGLDKETCDEIVRIYFEEILNYLLESPKNYIRFAFGYLSCFATTKNLFLKCSPRSPEYVVSDKYDYD